MQSQPKSSSVLAKLKGVKFFLQFQKSRALTAQGQKLSVANTVEHQLGKVTKARYIIYSIVLTESNLTIPS